MCIALFNVGKDYDALVKLLVGVVTTRSYELPVTGAQPAIGAVTAMNVYDLAKVLTILAPRISELCEDMLPRELSSIAVHYARARVTFPALHRAQLQAFVKYLPLSKLDECSRFVAALDLLGYDKDIDLVKKIGPHVTALLEAMLKDKIPISAVDTTRCLSAFARFGYEDRRLYDACCRCLMSVMDELDTRLVGDVLHALKSISFRNENYVNIFANRAVVLQRTITLWDIARILSALAHMNCVMQDVFVALADRAMALVGDATSPEVSMLMMAFTSADFPHAVVDRCIKRVYDVVPSVSVLNALSISASLSRMQNKDTELVRNLLKIVEESVKGGTALPASVKACDIYVAVISQYESVISPELLHGMKVAIESREKRLAANL